MESDPTPPDGTQSALPALHFDTALIAEHCRVLGPVAARRVVELFHTSLRERRAALHDALRDGDAAAVRRAGHAVKGLAASSGASLLAAAGEAVQHADDASLDELGRLVVHLDAMADIADAHIASAWGV